MISLVLAGIKCRDLVKSHYFDNTVKIMIYSLMTSYFNEILFDFVDQLDIENTKTSVWCIQVIFNHIKSTIANQIDNCKSNSP